MNWAEHVADIAGNKKACRFLVAIAERGTPPGRLGHS